jgi:hypothetical protein
MLNPKPNCLNFMPAARCLLRSSFSITRSCSVSSAPVLYCTLASLHFDPTLVSLNPAIGFVAASLAMSERVEATVSKV